MIGRSHKTVVSGIIIGSPPPERAHSAHVSVQTKPWVLGHNPMWASARRAAGPPLVHQCRSLCITSSSRPARATAAEYNPQAQTTHIYIYIAKQWERERREEREEEKEARTKGVFLQNNNNLDLEDNATLRQWQADPMRRGPQPRKVWTKNGCASRGRAEHTTPPPATTSAARSSSSIRSQTERYVSIERQLKHGFDHFITCQLLLPRRKQPRTSLPQPGKEVATRYLSIKRAQRLQSVDVIIRHTRAEGRATTGGTPPPPAPIQRALSGPTALGQLTPSTSKAAEARGRSSTVQVTVTGKPTADVSAQCVRHAARESHAAKGEPGGAGAIYYVLVRWYIVSQGARRGTHAQLGRAKAKAFSAPAARHTRYRSVLSLVRTGGSQPQTPPRISGLSDTQRTGWKSLCGIIIGSPPPERAFSAHVSVQTKPWVRLGLQCGPRHAAQQGHRSCIRSVFRCPQGSLSGQTSYASRTRAAAGRRAPQPQSTTRRLKPRIYIYIYSEAVGEGEKRGEGGRKEARTKGVFLAKNNNNLDLEDNATLRQWQADPMRRGPQPRKVWTKNGCASRGRAEHTTPPPATTSAARSSSSIRSQTERYVSIERQLKHGFDHFITCQLLLPRRKQPPRTSPASAGERSSNAIFINQAGSETPVAEVEHTAEGRATTGGTPPPPAPIQRALSGPTALGQLTPSTSKAAEARGRSSTVQVTVTGKPTADVSAQCVRHAARREPRREGRARRRWGHLLRVELGRAKAKASSAPAARHTRYRSVLSLVRTGGSQPQTPPRISGLPQTHSAPAGNHRRKCGIIIGSPPPERAHFSAHVSVQTKPWVRLGHNSNVGLGTPRSRATARASVQQQPAGARHSRRVQPAGSNHAYIYIYIAKQWERERREEREEEKEARTKGVFLLQNNNNLDLEDNATLRQWQADPMRRGPQPRKVINVQRSSGAHPIRFGPRTVVHHEAAPHTTPPPATTSAARSSSSIRSQTERYVSIERQLKHGFDHFITCQLLLPRRKQPPRTPASAGERSSNAIFINQAGSETPRRWSTRAEGRATTGGTPPPPAPIQRALSGPTALGQLTPSTSKAAEARGRSSTVQVTVTGKPTADVSAQCVRHAARRESHAAKGEPGGAGAIYYVLVRWYIVSQGGARRHHAQLGRAKAKASSAPAARHTRYRSVLSLVRTGGSQPQTPPRISGLPQTHSAPAGNHRRKCGIIIGSPPPERAHFSAHVSVQTKPWVRLGHNSMWASARRAAGPPLVHQCSRRVQPAGPNHAYIYIAKQWDRERREEGGRKRGTHKRCISLAKNNNNLDLEDNATLRQWQADPMRRGPQPRKVINVQRSSGAHPIRFGPRTVVHHEAAPHTRHHLPIERQLKHGFDHFITCQLLLPRRKQPPHLPASAGERSSNAIFINQAGSETPGPVWPPALGQLTPSTSKAAEARGRSSTVQVTVTGKPTADVSAQCVRHAARRESHAAKGEPGGAGAIYYVLVRWYIVSRGAAWHPRALFRAGGTAHTIQECSLAGPDRRQPAPNPTAHLGTTQTHSAPAGNHRRKCGIIIGSPPPERAHFSAHVSVQTKPWVRLGHNSMWASARRAAGPPLSEWSNKLCITHTSSSRRRAPQPQSTTRRPKPRIYIYIYSEAGEGEKRGEGGRKEARTKVYFSCKNNNNLDLEDNATLRQWQADPMRRGPQPRKVINVQRSSGAHPIRFGPRTVVHHEAAPHTTPPPVTTSAARSSSSIRSQTERYVSIERQLKHGFDHFINCQLLLPRSKPPRTSCLSRGKNGLRDSSRLTSSSGSCGARKQRQGRSAHIAEVEHTGGGQGHDGRHTPTAGSHSEGPLTPSTSKAAEARGRSSTVQVTVTGKPTADVSAQCSHAAKGEPGGAGAIYYVLVRWYIVSGARRGTHAQLGRAKAKASSAPAARHTIQECSLAGPDRRQPAPNPTAHLGTTQTHSAPAGNHRRKCGIIIGSPPPERAHFSAHVSVQTKPWVRLGHNSNGSLSGQTSYASRSSQPARATAAEYNPQAQTTHIYIYIYIYSEAEEKEARTKGVFLLQNNNNLDLEDNATLRQWQADPMRRGPQPRKVINVQRSSGAHPIRFGPRTVVHHEAAPHTRHHLPSPPAPHAAAAASEVKQKDMSASSKAASSHLLPQPGKEVATRYLSIKRAQRLQSVDVIIRQLRTRAEGRATTGGTPPPPAPIQRALSGPTALGQLTPSTSKAAEARGRSSTVQVTVTGKPTADVSAQCVRHAARRESHAAKGEPGGAGAIYYVLVRWYIVSQGARRGTHAQLGRAKAKASSAPAARHTRYRSVLSLVRTGGSQPQTPPRISGLPQTHSAPAGNHRRKCGIIIGSPPPERAHFSAHVSVQTKPWVRLGHNSNVGLGTPRSRATARASVQQQPAGARHSRRVQPAGPNHAYIYIYIAKQWERERREEREEEKEARTKGVFLLQNNNNLDLEDNATLRQWQADPMRRGPQPRKVINVQRSSGAHPIRFGPRTVVHHEAAPHTTPPPVTTSAARSSSSIRSQTERYVSIERQLKHGFDHFITCQLLLPRRKQPPRTSLPQPGKEVATRYLSIKRAQRLQSVDVIIRHTRAEGRATTGGTPPPPAPIQRALSGPTALGQLTPSTSKAAEARGRSSTVQVTVTGKPTADVSAQCVRHAARRESHAAKGEPGGAGAIYYVLVRWYIVSQGARRGTHAQLGRAKAKASSAPAARHTRYRSVLSLVRTGGSQPQTPPRISGLPQTHSAPAGNHRRKCGIIIGSPPPERAHFSAHVSVQTKPWVRLGHNSMWASARRAAGPPLVHQCRSLCITHEQQPAGARHSRRVQPAGPNHAYIYIYIAKQWERERREEREEEKRHAQKVYFSCKNNNNLDLEDNATLRQWQADPMRRGPQPRKVINVQRSSGAHPIRFGPRTVVHHEAAPHTRHHLPIERQLKHGFDHFITCQLLLPRRKQPPRTSLPQPGKEVATRYLSIKRAQRLQSVDVIIRHTRAEGRATTGGTPPPPAPIQRALSGPTALGQLTPSTSKAAEARGRSSTVQVTVTGKPTADVSAQCSHAAKGEPGGAGAIYYVLVRWYIVSQGARRGTHAQLGRAKAKASSAPAARHTRYRSVLSLVRTGGSQPQTPPRISGLPQTHSAPAGNHRRKCGIIIGSPPPERAHFSAHVSVQTKPWVRLGHNSNVGLGTPRSRATARASVQQQPAGARHSRRVQPAGPNHAYIYIYIYIAKQWERREREGGRKEARTKVYFSCKNNNNLDLEDNATLRQWQADPMRRGPQPRKVINVQRSSGAHPIRFGPRTVVHHEAAPHTTPPPVTTSAARSSSSIRSQTERYVSIERQLKHGFDHFITCQLLLPRRKQPPRTSLPQPGKEVATRYLSIKRAQRLQSVDVIIRHTRAEGSC
eukprot:gene6129-4409_t